MASETLTASGYIHHHLTDLTFGHLAGGHWAFANSAEQAKEMGFWAFNVDMLAWSLLLALFCVFLFRSVAKRATSGVPGGLQNFI